MKETVVCPKKPCKQKISPPFPIGKRLTYPIRPTLILQVNAGKNANRSIFAAAKIRPVAFQ